MQRHRRGHELIPLGGAGGDRNVWIEPDQFVGGGNVEIIDVDVRAVAHNFPFDIGFNIGGNPFVVPAARNAAMRVERVQRKMGKLHKAHYGELEQD